MQKSRISPHEFHHVTQKKRTDPLNPQVTYPFPKAHMFHIHLAQNINQEYEPPTIQQKLGRGKYVDLVMIKKPFGVLNLFG